MNVGAGRIVVAGLLCATHLAAQDTRDVRGLVLAPDARPLGGARVWVVGRTDTARADRDGRFVLAALARVPLRLTIRATGVMPDTVDLAPDLDMLTIRTRPLPVELAPLVVTGRRPVARDRFDNSAQPSTVTLQPAEISQVPALFEADVLRVIQLMPGSVAKNDYTIGYNVRGGEADQNLVQMDGIPIFNPSHLGGLFSTFDANAIARTDFYTGGFPAWYPGRLSSVLDLDIRPGNAHEMNARGQISLLSSKLLLEGSALGGTYLMSGRRTYADKVVSTFSREELPYYFTDLIGKVSHPLGRGTLSLTGYWGRDVFDFELVKGDSVKDPIDLAFNWGNGLLGLSWQQPLGPRTSLDARAGVSTFSSTLGIEPDLARFRNTARLFTAQTSLLMAARGHDLRVGAAVESYRMTYGLGAASIGADIFDARYHPTDLGLFADDQWHVSDRLILRPGLRTDFVTGPDDLVLSPRLSLKWFLTPSLAVNASAARYHQVIHSIRDQELPVTIYEFWIGADQFVPIGRADHLVLGLERWWGERWQFSVEGYRKAYGGLVTPNRAQVRDLFGDEFIPTDGWAWGGDVLLRKHTGAVRGWVAYGFTKTRRRTPTDEYPPAHDRRHTVNVVLFLPAFLGADVGVRWGYGSPLPYTGFAGEWLHRRYDAVTGTFRDSEREPIGAGINGERYPPYSRLDLSLRWRLGAFGGQLQPYLQLANVYNRKNVFLYFFDYGDQPPTRTGVSQLPLLPTFGLEFTF